MNRLCSGLTILILLAFGNFVSAQKRFTQDESLDNLHHAKNYITCELGELGAVQKIGEGPQDMILIAGAGFGGEVFEGFMATRKQQFTMYAVTLPGFAGTSAPPMPKDGTSYGEMTWTRAAVKGVVDLIDEKKLDRPIVVGHWMVASNVALQVALDRPNQVGAVILISGRAKNVPIGEESGIQFGSPDNRAKWVDLGMAPRWFKTVTRDTWDDNNYYPHDYSRNPIRALQLWRQAADAPLSVHVRYLCESLTQDSTIGLDQLTVPTLIIQPGFDDEMFVEAGRDYMRAFCHDSWDGVAQTNEKIEIVRIQDARVFVMDDQPTKLNDVITHFLKKIEPIR